MCVCTSVRLSEFENRYITKLTKSIEERSLVTRYDIIILKTSMTTVSAHTTVLLMWHLTYAIILILYYVDSFIML